MLPHDNESQYAAQINVKMSEGLKKALDRINSEHGIPVPELLRRLGQIAVDFERETHEMPIKHLRLMKETPFAAEKTSPKKGKPEPVPTKNKHADKDLSFFTHNASVKSGQDAGKLREIANREQMKRDRKIDQMSKGTKRVSPSE